MMEQTHTHEPVFEPYLQERMGTTIMAVKFNGGVIAAADSRTSSSSFVVDRAADKIDYVHDRIIVLRAGAAATSQNAARKVRYLIDAHSVELGGLPHVKTAAKMFSKMSHEKQLDAAFIVAGWDPYEGAKVFNISMGGSNIERDWTMSGSGSGYIFGFCDANYKPDMSFEEARQFCIRAISLAQARDGSSGGCIRLMRITKEGMFREFIDYKDIPYKK